MARRKLILDESTSEDDFQQRFEQYVPRDNEDFTGGRGVDEEDVPSSDHTPSPVHKRYISDEDDDGEKEEEEDLGGSDRIPSLSDDDIIEDEWFGSNGDSFRVRQRGTDPETGEKQRRRKKRKVVLDSDDQGDGGAEARIKRTAAAINNKSGTNRLWSEDDEIAILKGMISYRDEGGDIAHVSANIGAFHGHIKNFLKIGVSDTQLKDKIKRMKKKYRNNASRVDSMEAPVFAKQHEEDLFELSEMVWGSRKGGRGCRRDIPVTGAGDEAPPAEAVVEGVRSGDLWAMCPRVKEAMQMDEFRKFSSPESGRSFVMDRLRSVRTEEVVELESKWREVQKAEIGLVLMRAEAVQAQAQMILKALN